MTAKKTILVIEDNEQHFKEIKKILKNNNYNVLPLSRNKENFYSNEDFIKVLRTIYDNEIEEDIIEEEKRKLNTLLANLNIDGFIIDYELEPRKKNCSGINFYNNFISINPALKKKPILFLSGKKGNPINKLHEIINSINMRSEIILAYFLSKDEFQNDQFKTDLENKINEIFIDRPLMPKL
jgi:hypothetical protein